MCCVGKLIAFGALFGVEEEAIIMSSALSLQKSIFRVASSFVQKDPDDLNKVVSENFFAASYLDGGSYSEPIMYLRLLLLHEEQPRDKRKGWLVRHGLSVARFYHFRNWTIDCLRRVKGCLNVKLRSKVGGDLVNGSDFSVRSIDLTDAKLNTLRLILTWTSDNNIMRQEPLQLKSYESVDEVVVMSPEFSEEHLKSIFPRSVTWSVTGSGSALRNIRFLTDTSYSEVDSGERKFTPLIRDAKEGVRLLNALRAVHREGILFRRNLTSSSTGSVVGSKTWDRGSRDADALNYFSLKFRTWNLKWSFYNIQSSGGHGVTVYLPKQSLVSLACPINGGVLFGVSNKMSEHVTRDGKSVLNAEGVTLLPQGEKWLSLALHCNMGSTLDNGDIYTAPLGSLKRLSNSDVLSKKELRACISIGKHLFLDSAQQIRRCEEVITKVHDLFAAWIERPSVPDSQATGLNSDGISKPMSVFMPPLPGRSGSADVMSVPAHNSSTSSAASNTTSSRGKKQLCPWCDKQFSSIRDHIAFVHPERVAEYIEIAGTGTDASANNTKSGLTATAISDDTKDDDMCFYYYLSAIREYYIHSVNKRRMEYLLKYLRKFSKQCIFCRFQHSDDGVVFDTHLPELHALLKTVEQYTGAATFGLHDSKSSPRPFVFENAEKYDKRYEGSFSESLVPMIVNDHLRKVYGIKDDGRFGDKVNEDFRNFLANSRRMCIGNKCQFCSESFPDLPRHLVGYHLPEIHAAIGGLAGAVSKDTYLTSISKDDIMTGTTLIQPAKPPKVSKKAGPPNAAFSCPKCDHTSETPLRLADHFGGHFNAAFDSLSVKKKAAVKVKSSCPLCKDKKLFMQYGQLLDHITGSHAHTT